jgi:hypothetical protein
MIGYYAHHHGRGHVQRAACIASRLSVPMTILTSAPDTDACAGRVALARDDGPVLGDPTAGGVLHWAPQGHSGLRRRMATIAAWIEQEQPAIMVVDVSVEVAVLCRCMGVPVVVVAMPGDRTDRAHRLGYDIAAAAAATPKWDWEVLGGSAGWIPDPWRGLRRADVVVTHAGQNALAEAAAARVPAVVVPQSRPHDEQTATADVVDRTGLATVCRDWPAPSAWPALLDEAAAPDGSRWALWCPGDGADRAARLVERTAGLIPATVRAGGPVQCA